MIIIDGKKTAADLRLNLKTEVDNLKKKFDKIFIKASSILIFLRHSKLLEESLNVSNMHEKYLIPFLFELFNGNPSRLTTHFA